MRRAKRSEWRARVRRAGRWARSCRWGCGEVVTFDAMCTGCLASRYRGRLAAALDEAAACRRTLRRSGSTAERREFARAARWAVADARAYRLAASSMGGPFPVGWVRAAGSAMVDLALRGVRP